MSYETSDMQSTAVLFAKALYQAVADVISREIDELEELKNKGRIDEGEDYDSSYLDGSIDALGRVWEEVSQKMNRLGVEV